MALVRRQWRRWGNETYTSILLLFQIPLPQLFYWENQIPVTPPYHIALFYEFRADSLGVFVTFHRKKEIVAMWNGKDGDHEVTTKVTTKVTENQQVILNKLIETPEVTAAELSEILGISLRKTKDNMRKLREAGLIRHIGPNKGGHWEVIDQQQ